ncbi:MAG TPA: HD domain-containing protein [Acidimicrobiia bacterium]
MPEKTVEPPLLTDCFFRGFELARKTHRLHVRKETGIPYLAHLMSVCALVLEYSDTEQFERDGLRENMAIAALLHDAVEDSKDGKAMLTTISTDFEPEVASIVEGCSDSIAIPGVEKPEWRPRKEGYLAKLESEDETTLFVSACDKLHNARAIVADLWTMGDALWSRFNAGRDEQLWYYGALAELFDRKLRCALSDELKRAVEEMRLVAGRGVVDIRPMLLQGTSRIVDSSDPSAVERLDARAFLLQRVVVTEMVCRELADAAPDYFMHRCGTALAFYRLWSQGHDPDPSGDDALSRFEDDRPNETANTDPLRPLLFPVDPNLHDVMTRVVAAEKVIAAYEMMKTGDTQSEFESDQRAVAAALAAWHAAVETPSH